MHLKLFFYAPYGIVGHRLLCGPSMNQYEFIACPPQLSADCPHQAAFKPA
jgi:hypothetical protein